MEKEKKSIPAIRNGQKKYMAKKKKKYTAGSILSLYGERNKNISVAVCCMEGEKSISIYLLAKKKS